MSSVSKLKDVALFSTDKIDAEKISQVNFVSVDNLNPNKQGVCEATFQPKGSLVHFKKGDILVGNIRPYLKKIWLADKDGGCSPDVLVFKARPKTDNSFLYYSLFRDEFFEHMMTGSKGTKMPRGDKNQILQFEIPHFELEYQQKIASVLSALDAKIELNNKINAELEAMAKTLYDYWFVQFEFPISSAQTASVGKPKLEGKPYKSSGGKMVWNEELKREIPEGWEDAELQDIANITMGQSPPGESYNEIGNGTIFYQGCTDFGLRFPTIRQYTTMPSRFARKGDILLSVRAPVGTMNIALNECCIGRGLAALNSKENSNPYLFEVLKNLKQVFDRRNTDGTTFGAITKDDLFTLKVVKPEHSVLKDFSSIVNPVFEKQNRIALENQQLASLRDWLLPMLMNGQVRVGGVYGQTEEIMEHLMVAEPHTAYGRKGK